MKKGIMCLLLMCSIGVVLVGCGSDTNSNTNTNTIETAPGYIDIVSPSEGEGIDYGSTSESKSIKESNEDYESIPEESSETFPDESEEGVSQPSDSSSEKPSVEYGVEYVDENGNITVYLDPNPPKVSDNIKESFSEVIDTIGEYKSFTVSDIDYKADAIVSNAPDWLKDEYIFYPDDWVGMFCYALSVKMFGSDVSFENTDAQTKYHYNSKDFCMGYRVNGTDMCFVFCEDSSIVYVYEKAQELK